MMDGARRMKYFLLAVIVSLAAGALPVAAQEPSANTAPSFDVISIKEATGTPKFCKYLPDRVLCQISLLHLIKEAYQVEYFQLDAPKWMGDPRSTHESDHSFILEATMPTGTSMENTRLMLRQALADRFGLKVHRETRIIPAYALIPGKHGVNLQLTKDPGSPQVRSIDTPRGKLKGTLVAGPGVYMASAVTLDFFAVELGYRAGLDRPVVNTTGVKQEYDIDVHWEPTRLPNGNFPPNDPEFLAAVRTQLGLELEKRNLPVEVLVVDHAESTPSANQ